MSNTKPTPLAAMDHSYSSVIRIRYDNPCYQKPTSLCTCDAMNNRTRQPFDSAKVRFDGGAAAITEALASHVRGKGVNVQLDCTVDHISTAHTDAVRLDGVQVRDRLLTCSSLLAYVQQ